MPSVLIKNLPPHLHERLRRRAAANHRSMNREIIAILEKQLGQGIADALPPPAKPRTPIRHEEIVQLIREARDRKR